MNFWSDPAHLWLAVLVAAGTTVISVALFALVVKAMLDQFLASQREILERATLQTGSVDTALSIHGHRLSALDARLTMLEQDRMERDAREGAMSSRVARLEGL